jgi:hypothetical protein
MKDLLEHDKLPTKKPELIAGFSPLPSRPLRRSRSSESSFSISSTPSHFVGTAKGIEDCINCIHDYESESENMEDKQTNRIRAVEDWVSAIDADVDSDRLNDSMNVQSAEQDKGENVTHSGDESETQRQLQSFGLYVGTSSQHISGSEFSSPRIFKFGASAVCHQSSPKNKQRVSAKVGESFDNLSIGSAALFSQVGVDEPSQFSQSQPIRKLSSELDEPMESVDPDALSFSQASQFKMFSQTSSGKATPKSDAKRKKKPLVSGF